MHGKPRPDVKCKNGPKCRYGDRCTFAHDPSELVSDPTEITEKRCDINSKRWCTKDEFVATYGRTTEWNRAGKVQRHNAAKQAQSKVMQSKRTVTKRTPQLIANGAAPAGATPSGPVILYSDEHRQQVSRRLGWGDNDTRVEDHLHNGGTSTHGTHRVTNLTARTTGTKSWQSVLAEYQQIGLTEAAKAGHVVRRELWYKTIARRNLSIVFMDNRVQPHFHDTATVVVVVAVGCHKLDSASEKELKQLIRLDGKCQSAKINPNTRS